MGVSPDGILATSSAHVAASCTSVKSDLVNEEKLNVRGKKRARSRFTLRYLMR